MTPSHSLSGGGHEPSNWGNSGTNLKTRWVNLWTLLVGHPPITDLQHRRAQALQQVKDAESRQDDRDLGRARMVLQEATLAELRAVTR